MSKKKKIEQIVRQNASRIIKKEAKNSKLGALRHLRRLQKYISQKQRYSEGQIQTIMDDRRKTRQDIKKTTELLRMRPADLAKLFRPRQWSVTLYL